MSEQPDLDVIKRSLDFPPSPLATSISGYWRQQLLDVIDYAARLEGELAAARAESSDLRAALVNWGEHGRQCKRGLYPGIGDCTCGLLAALARGGGEG